ncbi:MAG: peptidoglycan DD-metalloendopeptidase family protein [Neisseriaceae bacterium]
MKRQLSVLISMWLMRWAMADTIIDNRLNAVQKDLKKETTIVLQKEIRKARIEKELARLKLQEASYQKNILTTEALMQRIRKEGQLLEEQVQGQKKQIDLLRKNIGQFLANFYRHPPASVLLSLLQHSGKPGDRQRQLAYVKYLQAAQKQHFSTLKVQLSQLQQSERLLQNRYNYLTILEQRQQTLIKEWQSKKREQQQIKRTLQMQIVQGKTRLRSLKSLQIQLNQMVRNLSKKNEAISIQSVGKTTRSDYPYSKSTSALDRASEDKGSLPGNLTQEDLHLIDKQHNNIVDSSEALGVSGLAHQKGHLVFPVLRGKVTHPYGYRQEDGSVTKGFVIESPTGSRVVSVAQGTVAYVGPTQDYGLTVIVKHDQAYASIYTGLSSVDISQGDPVQAGSSLGVTGSLYSGKNGLYFELRENTRPINPKSWF